MCSVLFYFDIGSCSWSILHALLMEAKTNGSLFSVATFSGSLTRVVSSEASIAQHLHGMTRSWCQHLPRGSPGFHSWPTQWDPGKWFSPSGTRPGAGAQTGTGAGPGAVAVDWSLAWAWWWAWFWAGAGAPSCSFPTYCLSLTDCTYMWTLHVLCVFPSLGTNKESSSSSRFQGAWGKLRAPSGHTWNDVFVFEYKL